MYPNVRGSKIPADIKQALSDRSSSTFLPICASISDIIVIEIDFFGLQIAFVLEPLLHLPAQRAVFSASHCRNDCSLYETTCGRSGHGHDNQRHQTIWFQLKTCLTLYPKSPLHSRRQGQQSQQLLFFSKMVNGFIKKGKMYFKKGERIYYTFRSKACVCHFFTRCSTFVAFYNLKVALANLLRCL